MRGLSLPCMLLLVRSCRSESPARGPENRPFLCVDLLEGFLLAFYVFILSKSKFEMCHCWFIINFCIVFAFKVPQSTLDSAIDPGYISRQWNGRKHGGVAQSKSSFVAHVAAQVEDCSQTTRTLCLSSLVFECSKLKHNCAKARALISQHARTICLCIACWRYFVFIFFFYTKQKILKVSMLWNKWFACSVQPSRSGCTWEVC